MTTEASEQPPQTQQHLHKHLTRFKNGGRPGNSYSTALGEKWNGLTSQRKNGGKHFHQSLHDLLIANRKGGMTT